MEGVAEIGERDLLDEICADRDRDSPRGQIHDFPLRGRRTRSLLPLLPSKPFARITATEC